MGGEVLLRLETLSVGNFPTTYLLQTPTHLVCQAIPVYSSTLYPDVGECKGRKGLSPPIRLPLYSWDTQHMKVDPNLDTMSMKVTTTLLLARNFHLYQESSTRAPVQRTNDTPTNK